MQGLGDSPDVGPRVTGFVPDERHPAAVALALNTRPRKTLDWSTPAEALDRFLNPTLNSGVATTG